MFTIYTNPDCNFCVKAKDLLNLRGEPFMEVDISKDTIAKEANLRRLLPLDLLLNLILL